MSDIMVMIHDAAAAVAVATSKIKNCHHRRNRGHSSPSARFDEINNNY